MASNCEHCRLRRKAEKKPDSLIGWLWRWHTKWCPGWRAYQKDLANRQQHASSVAKSTGENK